MKPLQIGGSLLLAAGVVLLIVGMNSSHSMADRWSNFFTGHNTDTTVWYIAGGIAALALGLSALLFGGNKAAS